MSEYEALRDAATVKLQHLTSEFQLVFEKLVLPGWEGPMHGLHRTLYGFMMNSFALVDLLSCYHAGHQAQNPRMTDFMTAYLGYDHLACLVAVKMWRHKLMHTGSPQVLEGRPSGRHYKWLMHWRDPHLLRDQHMTFNEAPEGWILQTGAGFLIEDLVRGSREFFQQADAVPELQRVILRRHAAVVRPELFDE